MGAYLAGSSVGTVVGPGANDDDRGSVSEALSPSTEAGQALLLVALGAAILTFTVARGEGGVVGKLMRVVEFVVIIAAATWISNYAARYYAASHPDGPLAAGLVFNV